VHKVVVGYCYKLFVMLVTGANVINFKNHKLLMSQKANVVTTHCMKTCMQYAAAVIYYNKLFIILATSANVLGI
jgi:hypothetical protein